MLPWDLKPTDSDSRSMQAKSRRAGVLAGRFSKPCTSEFFKK
jgi:hypothetical protein